jgi:hypothetical protein
MVSSFGVKVSSVIARSPRLTWCAVGWLVRLQPQVARSAQSAFARPISMLLLWTPTHVGRAGTATIAGWLLRADICGRVNSIYAPIGGARRLQ